MRWTAKARAGEEEVQEGRRPRAAAQPAAVTRRQPLNVADSPQSHAAAPLPPGALRGEVEEEEETPRPAGRTC